MEMKNLWLYKRHDLSGELATMMQKEKRHRRIAQLALLCIILSGIGGILWAEQTTAWSSTSLFGIMMLVSFFAFMALGATQGGKAETLKYEIGRTERVIEADLKELDFAIGNGQELLKETPRDIVRTKAWAVLTTFEKNTSVFREDKDWVEAVINDNFPPTFRSVCLEAVNNELEELEQSVADFKQLVARFGLIADASGKLEWQD